MNNCIKRMAYGYRDSDYFFLKIKATFLRKARSTTKKAASEIAGSPYDTNRAAYEPRNSLVT